MAIEINLFDSTATNYINQGESSVGTNGYIVENGKSTKYDTNSTGYRAKNTARNDAVFSKAREEDDNGLSVATGMSLSAASSLNKEHNSNNSTKAYEGFRYLDNEESKPDNSGLITMSNDTNASNKQLVGKDANNIYFNKGTNIDSNGKGVNSINTKEGDKYVGPATKAYSDSIISNRDISVNNDWVAFSMGVGDGSDANSTSYDKDDNGTLSATANMVNGGAYGHNYRGGISGEGKITEDADWISITTKGEDSESKSYEEAIEEVVQEALSKITQNEGEEKDEYEARLAAAKEELTKTELAKYNVEVFADNKPNSSWVNNISNGRGYTKPSS